jgi:hypothetical protein
MNIFQGVLGRLGLVQGATSSTPYNFGLLSAAIPDPLQDWTTYRSVSDDEVLSMERETLNQPPQELANAALARIAAAYAEPPSLSPTSLTVLNQMCPGISGAVELATAASPQGGEPASPESLQLYVVIIGGAKTTISPPIRLTYMVVSSAPDGFAEILANLETANTGGPIPAGYSRQNLAGLLLDMPSSYAPPQEYRFGAGRSLIVTLSFQAPADPVPGPEDFVWWNPSADQLTADADTSGLQPVTVGEQTGEAEHWTVHYTDGSIETTEDWSVWRLVLPLTPEVQLVLLGKATSSDVPVLDSLWPQLISSLTIAAS